MPFTFDEESVRRIVRAVLDEERRNRNRPVKQKRNWQPVPLPAAAPASGSGNCVLTIGCGLFDDISAGGHVLKVDNDQVAGDGLKPDGDCGVAVDTAEGVEVAAGRVRAKINKGLAFDPDGHTSVQTGRGTEVNASTNQVEARLGTALRFDAGGSTEVIPGGSITTVGGDVAFNAFAAAGTGLVALGPHVLGVDADCGLQFVNGQLRFNRTDVVGQGIEAGPGTCDLKVKLAASNSCLQFDGSGGLKVDSACLGGTLVTAGCGLEYFGGDLRVKNSEVAGTALAAEGTCAVGVVAGNAITTAGGDVAFDASPAAGDGLSGSGHVLSVVTGCGVTTSGGAIVVNRADLLGDGLEAGPGTCDIQVKLAATNSCLQFDGVGGLKVDSACLAGSMITTGCGLKFLSGDLVFDADTVAGNGLTSPDGCTLEIPNTGCGTTITSTGVHVNAAALAGNGLGTLGVCQLTVNTRNAIHLLSDAVEFNAAAAAGDGLSGTAHMLAVNTAGAIYTVSDAVEFNAAAAAGSGLVGSGYVLSVGGSPAITIAANNVSLNAPAAAGNGLTGSGEVLAVGAGPGITVQSSFVQFDADAAADPSAGIDATTATTLGIKLGNCLRFDGAGAVEVDPACLGGTFTSGCGIGISGNTISVDAAQLAGPGLAVITGCQLGIEAGCGIIVTSNGVAVDATQVAGTGLTPASGCRIDIDKTDTSQVVGHRIETGSLQIDQASGELQLVLITREVVHGINADGVAVTASYGSLEQKIFTVPAKVC